MRPGGPVRDQLVMAAYVCVERNGLAGTTVAEVAGQAGCSRATVYRHFPGGRDELLHEAVAWETTRFFRSLREAVAASPDLRTTVECGLVFARQAIDQHGVLQQTLRREPDRLLPLFAPLGVELRARVAAFLVPLLATAGVELTAVEWLADELARLILSLISTAGTLDLDDPKVLAAVVDGLVAPLAM